MTPRTRGALTADPDLLRAFREIATLQPIAVERPADGPLDARPPRRRGGRARHGRARRAARGALT